MVGLSTIDRGLIEAARAVGMSPYEQLVRVELPLALPVIVAGIRTATVWTVGAATLATPVGADSLGNYIFGGLQTRNLSSVLVGCVSSAVLALSLDGLAKLLLDVTRRKNRRVQAVGLGLCLALVLCVATALALKAVKRSGAIAIGAKTFTEQYILSEALALQIRGATGLSTKSHASLGSSVAFDALCTGAIDAYVDYSGTIWTTAMKRHDAGVARSAMLAQIDEYLSSRCGIRVASKLGFENGYALAMTRTASERYGIRQIGDLARRAPDMIIAGDYEFFARPEWQTITARYRLGFKAQREMDAALMYEALSAGSVDVVAAFSTDGRLAASDLVALKDDEQVIPPYDAIVLVGRKLIESYPEVVRTLRRLDGSVDTPTMRQLNLAVIEGSSPAEVARKLVSHWAEPVQTERAH